MYICTLDQFHLRICQRKSSWLVTCSFPSLWIRQNEITERGNVTSRGRPTERSRDEWTGLCEFVFSGLLNPLVAWPVLNVLNSVNILPRESTSASREKKNRTAECLRIWFVIHAKPDYIGVELRGWSVLRHLWFIARVLRESIASTYV